MANPIGQELCALLAETQALLDCPEPEAAVWAGYTERRNDLFTRLQALPSLVSEPGDDSVKLRDTIALVLEKDRLLVQKIQHLLSNVCQEMAAVMDKQRLFKAYGSSSSFSRLLNRIIA